METGTKTEYPLQVSMSYKSSRRADNLIIGFFGLSVLVEEFRVRKSSASGRISHGYSTALLLQGMNKAFIVKEH